MKDYCYIFWTAKHQQEVKEIIKALLEKKWIACASFFPVESLFIWEDQLEEEQEIKVILKSKTDLFSKVCLYIQEKASYDVSEILQIPITDGNHLYLSWMDRQLT